MARSKEMDLTTGNPFRSLLKFAIPVILGNLFQLFYTLADSVIVGKTLGADSLAAVGSTSIIIYFVFCFINGFTGGFGICLGQKCGAKDEKGMRKSVAVSALLSIIMMVMRRRTMMSLSLAGMIISRRRISRSSRRATVPLSARTAGARNSAMMDISMYPIMIRRSAGNRLFTRGLEIRIIMIRSTRRISLAGLDSLVSPRRMRIFPMSTRQEKMRIWQPFLSMRRIRIRSLKCMSCGILMVWTRLRTGSL